eukprot:Skav235020  [mRNA]  locus=scaffold276:350040:351808:+ [translate_table: standard]
MFASLSVLLLLALAEGSSTSGEALQGSDPSCFLQKKAGHQQLALKSLPPGVSATIDLCPAGEDCKCRRSTRKAGSDGSDFDGCASICSGYPGFTLLTRPGSIPTDCRCCTDAALGVTTDIEEGFTSATSHEYVRLPFPNTYENVCPEFQGANQCLCSIWANQEGSNTDRDACAWRCQDDVAFLWRQVQSNQASECYCCNSPLSVQSLFIPAFAEYGVFQIAEGGDVEGDPHIETLDGHHYTLLKQGTFSLWHFSGVESEVLQKGDVKKVPVDWHVYAHYSGSQSFTKALLLVDNSGGSMKQALELTSQDCEWRARSPAGKWTQVSHESSSGAYASTEFLVSKKSGANGHNHVRLSLETQKGKTEVAVLSLSCRPHHSINLHLVMRNRRAGLADNRFVDGELQTGRRDFSKLAMLQSSTSQDSEFAVQDSWQTLGGSEEAALYLETQTAPMSLLSTPCTGEAEMAAKETCSKHLGQANDSNGMDQSLQDCIFDLCHGADETVAELAAELRVSTRAIG